jgi:hypothetical protein
LTTSPLPTCSSNTLAGTGPVEMQFYATAFPEFLLRINCGYENDTAGNTDESAEALRETSKEFTWTHPGNRMGCMLDQAG